MRFRIKRILVPFKILYQMPGCTNKLKHSLSNEKNSLTVQYFKRKDSQIIQSLTWLKNPLRTNSNTVPKSPLTVQYLTENDFHARKCSNCRKFLVDNQILASTSNNFKRSLHKGKTFTDCSVS